MVLIHDFHYRYLHDNIVRLGFVVITLKHNERTLLKNNLFINILAADNCNPEICMKYFGCGLAEKTLGSTSIDYVLPGLSIDNNFHIGDHEILKSIWK